MKLSNRDSRNSVKGNRIGSRQEYAGESINHHRRQANSGITLLNELRQLRESATSLYTKMILQRDYRLLLEEESNLFILSMRIEFTIFLNKFVYTFHREERYSIYIAKNYRRTRNFLKIEFIKISTDVSIYWNFKGKTFDRLVLLKKKKVNFFFPKFQFQLFQKVKNHY